MRKLSAILLVLLAAPAGAPLWGAPPPARSPSRSLKANKLLRAGKYRCEVGGVLCNACTRVITEEVSSVPDVAETRFDFEDGYLWITVGKARKVRLSEIERALRIAARRLDFGVDFRLIDVQYVP